MAYVVCILLGLRYIVLYRDHVYMNFTSRSLLNRSRTHLASNWYYDNTRPPCHESAPAPRAPKYVLDGTEYIPECLYTVKTYFGSDDVYQLCLVGDRETMAADLDSLGLAHVYPFVHFTDSNLSGQSGIPLPVKEAIREVNALVSNPENLFNTTNLGIHTAGLVRVSEIEDLNHLDYGLSSWNGIMVYCHCNGLDTTTCVSRSKCTWDAETEACTKKSGGQEF
jgi:hypothetical protein